MVDYLQGLGLPIPLGKNPADTLIDFVFISEGHRKHGSTLDLVSKDVESSGGKPPQWTRACFPVAISYQLRACTMMMILVVDDSGECL